MDKLGWWQALARAAARSGDADQMLGEGLGVLAELHLHAVGQPRCGHADVGVEAALDLGEGRVVAQVVAELGECGAHPSTPHRAGTRRKGQGGLEGCHRLPELGPLPLHLLEVRRERLVHRATSCRAPMVPHGAPERDPRHTRFPSTARWPALS